MEMDLEVMRRRITAKQELQLVYSQFVMLYISTYQMTVALLLTELQKLRLKHLDNISSSMLCFS